MASAPALDLQPGKTKGKAKNKNKGKGPGVVADLAAAESEIPTYSAPGSDFLTGKKSKAKKADGGKLIKAPTFTPKVVGGKIEVDKKTELAGAQVVGMAEEGTYTAAKSAKAEAKKSLFDKADDIFESIGEIGETYSKVKGIFEGNAPPPSFGGGGMNDGGSTGAPGSTAPAWLAPVAIGAGVLVLVLVLKGRK